MKKLLVSVLIGFSAMTLLSGCIGLSLGGGTTSKSQSPTLGQQLTDLQTAKNSGAINESEFQTQKAKLLSQ
jgi:hypothetical protein